MKSGSGADDPFADIDDDGEDNGDRDTADDLVETDDTAAETTALPWRYARDSAKSERDMVQFFLQDDTQQLESQAKADLESQLGETVLVLDIREAAYQVALNEHLDDVADKLREWGYDFNS